MDSEMEEIVDKLSPIERKVLPYIKEDIDKIAEKSDLDKTTVLRALDFLESKGIIRKEVKITKIVDLGINGVYYKKNHLPERRLVNTLEKNKPLTLEEAKELSKLSENEFKVSLGVLRKKAQIELVNGRIMLSSKRDEIIKKTLEEQLIESLPLKEMALEPEQKHALKSLMNRKDIIEIREDKEIKVELTDLGKSLSNVKIDSDLIEELTPEVIKSWNSKKKFRKYDLRTQAPRIYGGKKHFVNQAQDYAREIWKDMGFKEMTGSYIESSFWVFDALFTPQDHPAREMQDTFFIKDYKAKILDKKLMEKVKNSHEKGIDNSKGWKYSWLQEEAEKLVLRTHTTAISAKTLSKLKKDEIPAKYFALGKCFRNETVDWSHGFEFNQSEGIVIDRKANFRHLLGYLKEFFRKMGFEKVRFNPCYFAYTEPSVEISVWHPEKKVWFELGGAGIFRPEVVIPLLGEYIPVLAWGPGFDRAIMDYYGIKDLRELYANDIKKLREIKPWIK